MKRSAFLYPFLLVVTIIIVLNAPRGIYDTHFLRVFSVYDTPFLRVLYIILSLSITQYDMMEAGHFRAELIFFFFFLRDCSHFWEK